MKELILITVIPPVVLCLIIGLVVCGRESAIIELKQEQAAHMETAKELQRLRANIAGGWPVNF